MAKAAAFGEPSFPIKDTGGAFPIDYEKFGVFSDRGTGNYSYKIKDREGLARAVGTGIYPNVTALTSDPAFLKWKNKNKSNLHHWNHVRTGNAQADFYAWALAKDVGPGTKLLFTASALVEAGHIKHALKAYHAVLVHFPKEACWSADHTFVWYVSNEALGQIEMLTTQHPEIGYQLKGARFKVTNGEDTNLKNDQFVIDPGVWVKTGSGKGTNLKDLKIIQQRGYGKVQAVQFENKHWQLRVDGKPFVVRGVTYSPTLIGQHVNTWGNKWMFEDANENGRVDTVYESWIDSNKNGRQDPNEPPVGDFELLKKMGANAIRVFRTSEETEYNPAEFNKPLLREMHEQFGIHVIMQDFLGAYVLGSGAQWDEGTDYNDPAQLENMRQLVKAFVLDHRSEPYLLMWVLGNENLMPSDYDGVNATRTKAFTQVEAYLRFVDEIARMIHQLDPEHPVAVGNLDLVKLQEHAQHAPQVDIFGVNAYRGSRGFGSLWNSVQDAFDRPVLVMEYGCDAYDSRKGVEDQNAQAAYHEGNWKDIQLHLAGGASVGNAVGGVVFEFVDEWWKSLQGSWDVHDGAKDHQSNAPDNWTSEEWFGLFSQGDGTDSPLLRRPRKAYFSYRDNLWKETKPAE